MILSLIQNIALLVALAAVYRVFVAAPKQETLPSRIGVGLLFGGAGIIGMMTPMTFAPGVIFDGRSIILSVGGLFGGPVVGLIAALMCGAYRAWLGGGGMWMGLSVIGESALLGVIFYELRRRSKIRLGLPVLVGFGFLVHAVMLGLMAALPAGVGSSVARQVGVYVLTLYPAATVLVSLFFLSFESQEMDREALLESEKALKQAQQVAHVGSWDWQFYPKRLQGSDETLRIFGWQRGSFHGSLAEIAATLHPDDRVEAARAYRLLAEESKLAPIEFRILRPGAIQRLVRVEFGELRRDGKGCPETLAGIVQDITEQRAAEDELRESQSRYRNLIMHAPDAILVNHDDRVVLANDACVQLFGARDEQDLIGKPVYELFHPDCHAGIQARIHILRNRNEAVPVAAEKIVRLDGRAVDVDVVAAPFLFQGYNDIHVILRDITGRMQMEQALVSSHELLTRLAEQVPGVVYQYRLYPDGRSRFPYASPGMEEIYEVTPEEVLEDATVVFGRLHPEDYDRVSAAIWESARAQTLLHVEFRVVLPRRGVRWRLSNAKPQLMEDGSTLWYGIITDITDRKLAEQQIHDQLEELRRWHAVMLGREDRILELKGEVNQTLLQAGLKPRYQLQDPSPEEILDHENDADRLV